MLLRLPQTLNARLGGGPLAASASHANPLLDWSVRAFAAGKKEYVLLSNTRSLYSAVLDGVAGETCGRFAGRVMGAVPAILDAAGQLAGVGIDLAPESVRFAKTLDRSVTGSMNELVAYAEMLLADGDLSVPEVGVRLNDLLLSALARAGEKYGTPRVAFAALVAGSGLRPHGIPNRPLVSPDMIPLHRDRHFTFRFGDDRIIPRFHLDGVAAGVRVSVFRFDAASETRLGLIATATVGEGGRVDLPEPLVVRAGEGFVAVPEEENP